MQGSIIITDRYPNEFIDGPRITPDSSIKSFLSDLEKKNYLKLPTPDIVFKIHSPIEVTLERNSKRDIPDPEDFVRVRYQLASKVDFKTTTQIDIDTTKGLEETIINLKKFFWFRNTSV